ncbi:hypothetical protein ACFZCU_46175 [Streptomyces canus]|jgi:hypothetical protein|uniref:hypothetical protein n=1 Tax=Streptomyces canus TaxID=58343 RepID=UPI0036E5A057
MPRGVYKRSEAQINELRERAKSAGAAGSPSAEARQRMSQERTEHGHSKRGATSPTYQTWRNMRSRCENPNVPAYKNYGGRGITVCERWKSFDNFLADMGERPEGMTIERIDNDGNYEPSNCRWSTYQQQGRNTRANRRLTWNGETKTIIEWAETLGVKAFTISARLRMGWTTEDALTRPVRGARK